MTSIGLVYFVGLLSDPQFPELNSGAEGEQTSALGTGGEGERDDGEEGEGSGAAWDSSFR
jgi:hypothetical protein